MNLKIAAQYYTLRDFCRDEESIKRTSEKVAAIGYKYVQISGVAEIDNNAMRKIMDDNGLTIVATHFSFDRYLNNIDEMIEKHKIFGCENAGIGSMPMEYRGSEEAYAAFGRKADEVAEKLEANGIHFIYHNHSFEFRRFGKKTGLDLIYDNSKTLNAELDTHWVVAGGGDPVAWVNKLAGRMHVIHYKDFVIDEKGQRCYAEIGEGNLNWAAINAACDRAGIDYCIVEQDDCYDRDPFDSLAISYKNMKEMGLN